MNKGQEEVNNNDPKQVSDDTVTLQARDSVKTSKTQDNAIKPVDDKTNTQSSLQEPPRTKTTEIVHYYHVKNKDTHEERMLQIEELDDWLEIKSYWMPQIPILSLPHQMRKPFLRKIMSSSRGEKAAVLSSKRRRGPGSSSVRATAEALTPLSSTYDSSLSKASALPPSLRYLHAILAHTLTRRRESTGVINTHDAYYLWCMANAHVTDLAYFIAFAIRHQTEQHRKGVISIGLYVTRLARHFGLINTMAQSSALTLIGQISPQGITTMLHMRMIERRPGTDPLQYYL
ncbi:hypothetical protein GOBAR_AA22815 [Gossypium barbadense]|uniref:Uncharacterized protein n=1 Tax=Gossypium barbadense TaxID=3634 RepID=A0A2P5X3F3_GOSBA|nr:hypothetical protein GOBAR_AA22815 [Gossypium barbadense]